MDSIDALFKWIWVALSGAWSYLMYRNSRIDKRLDKLEAEFHQLDKTQAEISVEIKEIKNDIGYIRKGLDKIIEKL